MPTRPTGPTPSAATDGASPFAGLGAGLGFFQDWMKAAGSALPHLQGQAAAAPGMPGMPAWSMPTLDPEELDKRIQELKTVQFWLEQNARMIAMTIQGLEVQKMTLSTLQGMNVSMDTLREGLKARVPDPTPPTPEAAAPQAGAAEAGAATATGNEGDLINPMRWWDTLTQQFTHLASQATQTAQSVGETVEASMQDMVAKAQAAAAPAAAAAADAVKPRHAASAAPRKTPARKATASKTAATAARKASPKA